MDPRSCIRHGVANTAAAQQQRWAVESVFGYGREQPRRLPSIDGDSTTATDESSTRRSFWWFPLLCSLL